VSEDVWASALLFDEAEPLFRVEPLHCPRRHDAPFHPVQTALGPLPTAIFRSAPYCHPWAIVLGLRIHSRVLVEVDRHLVPLDAPRSGFGTINAVASTSSTALGGGSFSRESLISPVGRPVPG
jgi:hypothetical protein